MKAAPYNKAEATKTTAENNKHTEDKEMSENMKLNDEAMAQASGGKLEPGDEVIVNHIRGYYGWEIIKV